MKMTMQFILFALGLSLLSGCAAGKPGLTSSSLVVAYSRCRDEGQECFESLLGPGRTGITEDGDIYESWTGNDKKEYISPSYYRASHPEAFGYGPAYRYTSCKLEINFRDNKVYAYQFTGQCGY